MSEKIKVLILGAGIMQIPAITTAKKHGWRVTVADGNPHAPGVSSADRFEPIDLKDQEGMLRFASELKKTEGLDGIFTAGTDFSATVAYVAEQLGLPGIPHRAATNASNKAKMRTIFKQTGVPSTGFLECARIEQIDSITGTLDFPLVIKPVDNMGARGIRRVDSIEELKEAFPNALEHSASGRVIVEEYIDGPEFSLDAIIHKGCITICGVADRHICFPPYFVEMGHTMPSSADERVISEVCNVFKKAVTSLSITDGAAKGDMFMSSNGPVVGEIAARLSGGYMSGWTYPYASGVDVTHAALRIAVGMSPGDLTPAFHRYSAERAFLSIPGMVASIHGTSDALEDSRIKHVFTSVAVGEEVCFPTNNVQKCGNFISSALYREEAVASAIEACGTVVVRLSPGHPLTERFLFANSHPWVPDAYTLTIRENCDVFRAMQISRKTSIDREQHPKIAILGLPFQEIENDVDWQARPWNVALGLLTELSDVTFVSNREPNRIDYLFWKAFLRGGVQGGLWMVDTIQEMRKEGRTEPVPASFV